MKKLILLLSVFILTRNLMYGQNDPCSCSNHFKINTESEKIESSRNTERIQLLKTFLSFNYEEIKKDKEGSMSFLVPAYFSADEMHNESSFKLKKQTLNRNFKLDKYLDNEATKIVRYRNIEIGKDFNQCIKECNERSFIKAFYEEDSDDLYRISIIATLPGDLKYIIDESKLKNGKLVSSISGTIADTVLLPKGFSNSTGTIQLLVQRKEYNKPIIYSASVLISNQIYSFHGVIPPKPVLKQLDFRNGREEVSFDSGYSGQITIEPTENSIRLQSDDTSVGVGKFILPIPINENTKTIKLKFRNTDVKMSGMEGNATIFRTILHPSNNLKNGSSIQDISFYTTKVNPITEIKPFVMFADVREYAGKDIYLIFVLRDAWDRDGLQVAIQDVEMTQE